MITLALCVFAFAFTIEAKSTEAAAYCSPVKCEINCDHGFKTDDNGCDVCSCRDKPCPSRPCSMFCPRGFKIDENGCTLCECRSEVDVVKPGNCPAQPVYEVLFCTFELHTSDCRADQDCFGDRKCCKNVCRNKCMDPA